MINPQNFLYVIISFFLVISGFNSFSIADSPFDQVDFQITLPQSVEIGDPIDITCTINPDTPALFPDSMILIIKAPQDSHVDRFTTLKPDKNRTVSIRVPADVIGKWYVSCTYGEKRSPEYTVAVDPRSELLETMITIRPYIISAHPGSEVTMQGRLTDILGIGIPNKQIQIEVALPPYGCAGCTPDDEDLIWNDLGNIWTGESGLFEIPVSVDEHGRYRVRAAFGGDEIYLPVISSIQQIRVN